MSRRGAFDGDNGHAQTRQYQAERKDWRAEYREEIERVRQGQQRGDYKKPKRFDLEAWGELKDRLPPDLQKAIAEAERRRKAEEGG